MERPPLLRTGGLVGHIPSTGQFLGGCSAGEDLMGHSGLSLTADLSCFSAPRSSHGSFVSAASSPWSGSL